MQTIRGSADSRRRLQWLRATAASVGLFALLVVGHVLPALHFALVAHRICAEHGELVHEAAPLQAAESRSSAPEAVAGVHAAHEHEHCGVLALPGSPVVPPTGSEPETLLAGAALASVGAGELPAHVGIALLCYAPKLAPPA